MVSEQGFGTRWDKRHDQVEGECNEKDVGWLVLKFEGEES